MSSYDLTRAKNAKFDEFYTQFHDIGEEVNKYINYNKDVFKDKTILLPCDDPEWSNFTKYFVLNFKRFKLKKLISTSYAVESKSYKEGYQPTQFEKESPNFDKEKTRIRGKIFIFTKNDIKNGKLDTDNLEWHYLEGDGDFNSDEVKKLRNEVDIIITNPPFSLFRKFLAWIMEANKKFLIIGNLNAISYKDVFSLIKENKIWLGVTNGPKTFIKPDKTKQTLGNICWFTNLEHGLRHQKLSLMSMNDNLKYNKKVFGNNSYDKYDNYDAIEVPYVSAIPKDYDGLMGVPLTFLETYNPDQFEIVGIDTDLIKKKTGKVSRFIINGKIKYARILIRNKNLNDC